MASTSAPISATISGYTELPGLKVGPYGGILSQLKVYNFGITDTRQITATSTAGSYTVSGLSTNDVPLALAPSTGITNNIARPGLMIVSAANTLDVLWTESGTSSATQPGVAAPGVAWTLLTMSYYAQSPSTTT